MIEILKDNIEWIFSGVGLVVLGSIISWAGKIKFSVIGKQLSKLYSLVIMSCCSKESILKRVDIDIRARNKPFELWLHELPQCRIWLRATNLNRFDISIKKISIEYNYGGLGLLSTTTFNARTLDKQSIDNSFLVEDKLSQDDANYIAEYIDEPRCCATITATIKAGFKEIIYQNRSMDGISPSLINVVFRKNQKLSKTTH
ncbi:hypothetical protein [Salinimonas chungwhensis]|uniref:hypothetical protein n=1 Tax=Salinimonas chungwhensis TaxID=265425 RepID=UPI00035C137F|nr:hypothetical protein [Salinimonas chungwhensis]